MSENTYKITINKLDNSEIEILGSISFDELSKYREKAIKKMGADVSIPGFRKGHVSEEVLLKKTGEMALLYEMAEMSLSLVYPNIIIKNKIDAIGSPEITILKIAPNNPLEFKIKTEVMPTFELNDYKKIAKKEMAEEEKIEVTDKEIEEAIMQIRKRVAQQEMLNKAESPKEIKDEDLPEVTDELVKILGDFKDVADFKGKLKENILHEKEHRAKEKKRMSVVEKIIDGTKIELPKILVERELEKLMAQFRDDISRMGLKFDKYLEYIKKTEEDLRKEWRTDAEKRAKMQLILNKIAVDEDIKASQGELEKNVAHLMDHYKEAKEENVRIYVETMLVNEEVFKFLEGQK